MLTSWKGTSPHAICSFPTLSKARIVALQSETQQNNIESNSVNNDNIVNNNYQYHDCINKSIGKDYDDDEETQMTETVIKVMMVNWYSLYVLANVQNVPGISLQYRDTGSGHWTLHC